MRFRNSTARVAVLALLGIVLIAWQLAHAIILRNTLLIVLGLMLWPRGASGLIHPASAQEREVRVPFAIFAAFLAWLAFVAAVVSDAHFQSFRELRAEWLPPALVLLMGYGAGLAFARRGSAHAAVRVAFWGLVAHAVMHIGIALGMEIRGQEFSLETFGGVGDHRANVTYTNTLAVALLGADTIAALWGRSFLGLDWRKGLFAFGLLLLSTLLSGTRNGVVAFTLLTLFAGFFVVMRLRGHASRMAWAIAAGCAAFTLAVGIVGLNVDPRWSSLAATIPVAWDTPHHREWLLGERNVTVLPYTAAGKPVEPSAYYRIAYLREGLDLVAEHPWGTRIGRNAYKEAIHAKYGTAGMAHGHNGYIDLAVSAGWPGVAIWLAFLASLAWVGFRARATPRGGYGIALALVVAGFALRTLVDATLRDHILQEFMLVAGLLAGAAVHDAGADRGA